MSRLRAVPASLSVTLVLVAACSGQSQEPPTADQQLACEVSLTSACCDGTNSQTCIESFTDAERCSNWASGATVLTYPDACGGYQVVSVTKHGDTFAQYYLYAQSESATLFAILDDADVNPQGAVAIECGAGPGLTLPGSCSATWLDASLGAPCSTGATTSSPQTVPCGN